MYKKNQRERVKNVDGTNSTVLAPATYTEELKVVGSKRKKKEESLETLVVTHNTVAYDANGRAIGNMSAIMGVANFKYNQAVSNGVLPSDAYQAIYKDTKIFWRGADNINHEVMIESVCETLEKSMMAVSDIVVA